MILVIDNYDSFTYNLVHYLEDLGAETLVRRNDALTTAQALRMGAKAVVLSPGPCAPAQAGICLDLLRSAPISLPILGVCLGHQAIGEAFGGRVQSAQQIVHGKTSPIHHHGNGLFIGLPTPFTATRYHSLAVARDHLPAHLLIDAETDDGEIMGLRHAERPVFGVQFHPESIASEHGHTLLRSFLDLAGAR
jgi:anthranilate synthase component 2